MSTVDQLRKLRRKAALRDIQEGMFRRGISGRWNDNGSLTASDEPGTLLVRIGATDRNDKRPATRVTNSEVDTAVGLHVILWMVDGEWDVFCLNPKERFRLGAAIGNAASPRRAGDLVNETVNGRRLKEGRVRVWQTGTLMVNAERLHYVDSAGNEKVWAPDNTNVLDLASFVPPANERRWVRVALNPDAATPALEAFDGIPESAFGMLDESGWLAIAVPNDFIPLDSVLLLGGDTTIPDDGRYAFSRLLLHSAEATRLARAAVFVFRGTLSVVGNPLKFYNEFGATRQISRVSLSVSTAPAGADIIVDIHKDGTTIFTDPDHRPRIEDGETYGAATTIDVAAWASGEYLEMQVDQVGSGTPGANLVVQAIFR